MSGPTNEAAMENSIFFIVYALATTAGAHMYHIGRIILAQMILIVAGWLLNLSSTIAPEALGHGPIERTEPANTSNIDSPPPYDQEPEDDFEPDATPENVSWIMDYPSNPPSYHSSNSSSGASSIRSTDFDVIPTLEALWADWDPQPEPMTSPDRPTTPGILESALANDTGELDLSSLADSEASQSVLLRSASPDSPPYIFNPTGELEMSDIE
ncbi:hypothetical protein FQN49_005763 [Arthroderma sp. PD_2]|nr:hypothetical protein FQN49_005763 [Arthroderma sp. PD_2]